MDKCTCFICKSNNAAYSYDGAHYFYDCPICGRYMITNRTKYDGLKYIDKVKAYLYYHNNQGNKLFYVGNQNAFNNYKKEHPDSVAILVTEEMIDAWYPNSIEDKFNYILVQIHMLSKYDGQVIAVSKEEAFSLFFTKIIEDKSEDILIEQVEFYLDSLRQLGYIESKWGWTESVDNNLYVSLTAKGLAKVYELTKNRSDSKNVFVAMKFGEDTKLLRETIRKGIANAGYTAVIIDEQEYNGQIVPEMLKAIRDSRFVIAELSHHNNGAYYEAGYASGLGKEVIQICSEQALKEDVHFDVRQINSITYDENDLNKLSAKITNRIKATIG